MIAPASLPDGCRVVITGGKETGARLARQLAERGARVCHVPLIATQPRATAADCAAALATLSGAAERWVSFSSATAVRLLLEHAGAQALSGARAAAVGEATAAELRRRGVEPALVARAQTGAALAEELVAQVAPGAAVLVIEAAGGGDAVARRLAASPVTVRRLVLYASVLPPRAVVELRACLEQGAPHAVTFSSGSAVRHWAQATGSLPPPGCAAVCIGPSTAAEAARQGWSPVWMASEPTAEALVDALSAGLERQHDAQPLP